MAEKNLYIGYDEQADELIMTSNPKAKTAGYFIDSGTAVLLDLKTISPVGFSFLFLRGFFKKHKNKSFAKVPLTGKVVLPSALKKQLPG